MRSVENKEKARIRRHKVISESPIEAVRDTYHSMLTRCYNPTHSGYRFYGGRGIKVCDLWKNSFQMFAAWMIQSGWKRGLQLDRIDSDGDYSPANCQILTQLENLHKTRRCKLDMEYANQIRGLRFEGLTNMQIGNLYGVSQVQISRIKNNLQWAA